MNNNTTAKIASFVEGFSDTGRFPYVYALLDCGHTTEAPLRPTFGTCIACGLRGDTKVACVCGRWSYKDLDAPKPHNAADRLTKIGDEVTCKTCAAKPAAVEAVRAALLDPKCSHTRYRQWCGSGSVYVYHRDTTSPSGVLLACTIRAEWFDELYAELRAAGLISSSRAPLSPTEGLGGN